MARPEPVVLFAALLATSQAHTQSLDSARAFVRGLYEAYRHGEPDYLGARARATFAPQLLALIRHDQATTPAGDVGTIDGDPICDCQDDGGMKVEHVEVAAVAPGRAVARATVKFAADVTPVRLDLVAWRGQWRVADVHTKAMPSLVRLLNATHAAHR
jgi:hypothetical protein